ncbi:glutamate-gated chloride channel subunit beta-like [Dermacentor silvarum]|uniref:glutamate-gated chloride channel subunit beta-like n=1 Tax=Dermacentor silvarum TaxID=543639 RepID=UPI002100912D|nr:glutamate-gated chloride channel subunit beta-like [Dermacentor silvarum]
MPDEINQQATTQSPLVVVTGALRLRDPPFFNGTDDHDVEEWLATFEKVIDHNKWDDPSKLQNVSLYLKDVASLWYHNHESDFATWSAFKTRFADVFDRPAVRKLRAEERLRGRTQQQGENFTRYIEDVIDLCKRLNPSMPEQEKIKHILKGPYRVIDCLSSVTYVIQPVNPTSDKRRLGRQVVHVLDLDMVFQQRWAMTQPVCKNLHEYFGQLPTDDESPEPAYRCRRLFATVFWLPDTYFPDASSANVLSDPFSEKSLCLFADWEHCYFKYIQRIFLHLNCPMEFKRFPADVQICPVHIDTFAHRNVHYIWEETTPVSMNPELSRPAFRVELRPETNEEYMHRGQLYISVVLSRLLAPQLIEAYIPSAFLVVVSWLIFWLDAATERVAVCVTILLALYSQSTGARQLLPPSTSMTALDHWMVVCVLFVFAALAQTAQGMWTKRPLLEPARTPVNKAAWIWAIAP